MVDERGNKGQEKQMGVREEERRGDGKDNMIQFDLEVMYFLYTIVIGAQIKCHSFNP